MANTMRLSNGSSPITPTSHLKTRSWGILFTICTALLLITTLVPLVHAAPVPTATVTKKDEPEEVPPSSLWVYLSTAVALVLLGGVFAGLTIAYVLYSGSHIEVLQAEHLRCRYLGVRWNI